MKHLIFTLFAFLCLTLFACQTTKYPNLEKGLYAELNTDKGIVLIELFFKETPLTTANFVALAEGKHEKVEETYKGKPFFDGLKFHRVIPNFMVQGGDPKEDGSGGPGYAFPDEFPKDDEGNLLHKHDKPGVISMANRGAGTNGSQFFITHKETPWLDGKHTIFGQVTQGQEVIDSIAVNDLIETVNIIRIGRDAKKFDAVSVFNKSLEAIENELKQKTEAFSLKMNKSKANILPSGLGVLVTQKGIDYKVVENDSVTIHYTGYLSSGKIFDSSVSRGKPLTIPSLTKGQMIPGFFEGLLALNVGEKATLFIPSNLGYGPNGRAPIIPGNADLVFEIEVLKSGIKEAK